MSNFFSSEQPNKDQKKLISNPQFFLGSFFYPSIVSGNCVVQDGIVSIEDNCFFKCSTLTRITLPSSLLQICDCSFYSTNISTISIPESVTSIGDNAFYGCTSLTSISLYPTMIKIGNNAFTKTNLTELIIPEGVTSIGDKVNDIYECLNTVTTIRLPSSLKHIGDFSFYKSKITNIEVPPGLTKYDISVPLFISVMLIERDVFYKDYFLTVEDIRRKLIEVIKGKCEILEGITAIGNQCFYECTELNSVSLPSSLRRIGEDAFNNTKIKNIKIPQNVSFVGNRAFPVNCLIKFNNENKSQFILNEEKNEIRNVTVIEGTEKLSHEVSILFKSYRTLTSITIPHTIKHIDNDAFEGMSVNTLIISEGMTELGDGLMKECHEITCVKLPRSLILIKKEALSRLHIEDVIVPEGVTKYDCKVPLFIKRILEKKGVQCPNYEANEEVNDDVSVDIMMIVGKYFEISNDFINLMKVCKKYNNIVMRYHFNPIGNPDLFEKMETQHFYKKGDYVYRKEGMYQYIFWFKDYAMRKNLKNNEIIKYNARAKYIDCNIKQLEEWSGRVFYSVLYDSDVDGKQSSIFRDKILNHNHLYFIVIDEYNNVFGHYHESEIYKVCNKGLIDSYKKFVKAMQFINHRMNEGSSRYYDFFEDGDAYVEDENEMFENNNIDIDEDDYLDEDDIEDDDNCNHDDDLFLFTLAVRDKMKKEKFLPNDVFECSTFIWNNNKYYNCCGMNGYSVENIDGKGNIICKGSSVFFKNFKKYSLIDFHDDLIVRRLIVIEMK